MKSYPINLVRLEKKRCVVVGGGDVALRKAQALLDAGALRVVVISPRLDDGLSQLQRQERIEHIARGYRPGDLKGAFLVIATTDDPEVNRSVSQEAADEDILVNVVDDPDRCNFIVPSTLRRGDLVVGVSTGGQSPALAAGLRRELERTLGSEYSGFLELAGDLRRRAARELPASARASFWHDLAASQALALLRDGEEDQARRLANELLAAHLTRANGSARR